MPREFLLEREHTLPAGPDDVWHAVATGPGTCGWLYPMDVEPRVGGTVSRGPATVTAWQPPQRFACRYADDTGFSNTLSYALSASDAAQTLMRMSIHWVHTGEPDDGWDTRADAATRYADFYHHSLREYLTHFRGRTTAYVRADRPAPATEGSDQFARVVRAVGVGDDAAAGDGVLFAPQGMRTQDAVVDYRDADFLGLRTEDGLYRFFNGAAWQWPLWLGHHLYGETVDTDTEARSWSAWLEEAAA
ncbi:SRPBCC family protein [Yinghuangia sp. YIM S10712]|uniref:SRPBCC family protein n=1 Tax=Yinghuangia sp. YIM S10712 TaxID=3436930 RepID=UPI003F531A55